VYYLSNPA